MTLVRGNWVRSFFSILFTFSCVVIGWVFFRSSTFGQGFTILGKMYNFPALIHEFILNHHHSDYSRSLMTIGILLALCFMGPVAKALEEKILSNLQQFWLKQVLYSFGVLLVLVFMFSPIKPFIYFVF